MLDVNLDRFFGDEEPLCDIAIPISTGNVTQNVDLTIRERFVGEMLGEVRSDFRRDVLFPLVDFANRLNHLFGGHALQQVRARSRCESALNLNIACEHCQQDYASVGEFSPDREHDIYATEIGKPKIHQSDIRSDLAMFLDSFPTAGCRRYQLHVGFAVNHRRDSLTQQRVIIDAQYAY